MKQVVLTAVVAGLVAFGVVKLAGAPAGTVAVAPKETAYERVMRTKTLRCGYIVLPPEFTQDTATGTFGGVAYDLVMAAAERLGIKIEWTEAVNFGTMYEGLKTGRYDALCFTLYRDKKNAWYGEASLPIFYSATYAYVKKGNEALFSDPSQLNQTNIKVSTLDGEMADILVNERFPNATKISLPQTSGISDMFMNVANGKADVTFSNHLVAHAFMASHPGLIAAVGNPLMVFAHTLFTVPAGDVALKTTMDAVIAQMLDDGTIDHILKRHEPTGPLYKRVIQGYRE